MPKPSIFQRALAALLLLGGCSAAKDTTVTRNERWVPYYDVKVPVGFFADYDLVVFEPSRYVDFKSLQPKTTVLAYLTFGEEHAHSEYIEELKANGGVVKKNANWPSYIMDIRNPRWRQIILEERIPDIVAKGFDGIMLDTIESPLSLDNNVDKRYFGLHAACVSLIREIRQKFPKLKIMQNRAFVLLHETGDVVDYVLAESVMTTYDGHANTHRRTTPSAHTPIYETLRLARARNPHLKIYTLDYWNMNDVKAVKTIYQEQRSRGFIPHVTTPDLRTFYDEQRLGAPDPLKPRG